MYVNIQFMKTKVHMYMYFLEWSQKLCCTIWHISAEKAGSKLVKSSITPQRKRSSEEKERLWKGGSKKETAREKEETGMK